MTPEALQRLDDWLVLQRAAWKRAALRRRYTGTVYDGPADFVLQHGVPYDVTSVSWGIPNHCYANAMAYAVTKGWSYVEGYAIVPLSQGNIVVAGQQIVQHSWALDSSGQPVEVTWPIPGQAYRGVVFSVERADDCTWNGDATVLDDYQRNWPLLQKPWTGETYEHPWSDRLDTLRDSVAWATARSRWPA